MSMGSVSVAPAPSTPAPAETLLDLLAVLADPERARQHIAALTKQAAENKAASEKAKADLTAASAERVEANAAIKAAADANAALVVAGGKLAEREAALKRAQVSLDAREKEWTEQSGKAEAALLRREADVARREAAAEATAQAQAKRQNDLVAMQADLDERAAKYKKLVAAL